MLTLVVAAALASPLLDSRAQANCPANPQLFETVARAPGTLKRLDELPPAAHVLTLYRAVDRCAEPVVLRAGIGNAAPAR